MGRKTETDEQKVKKVYPDARCEKFNCFEIGSVSTIYGYKILNKYLCISSEIKFEIDAAWSNALKQINAAKRKKYYKPKITRPNNEKKVKATIMLYPSDRTAVIEQYGSVQKFINSIVEQLKTN